MTSIFRRAFGAALIIATTGGGVMTAGQVEAGAVEPTGGIDVVLTAEGVGSADALDGLTLELFVDNGASIGGDVLTAPSTDCVFDSEESGVAYTSRAQLCTGIPTGDYVIGVDGVPEGWDVEVDCFDFQPPEALEGTPGAYITVSTGTATSCDVYVIQPADLGVAIFAATHDTGILDALTLEAYTDPGGVQSLTEADCRSENGFDPFDGVPYRLIECDLADGFYVLGLDGLSDAVTEVFGFCDGFLQPGEQLDSRDFGFVIESGITECDVYLEVEPQVLVDVLVTGGDHPTGATIEIFDDEGSLVASTVDPNSTPCTTGERTLVVQTDCGIVSLPAGDYEFGVVLPDYGYTFAGNATCTPFGTPFFFDEALPGDGGTFTHGASEEPEGPETNSLCTIPLRYVEQTVSADIVVVNDDAGASDGSDFVIEVYDGSGTLVDSAADPEPGTGNASAEFTLPIGDYTFGVSGPDGYEVSVVVTPVTVDLALIDAASAAFSLDPSTAAFAVLTADDSAAAATTTTVAPTTTIDDGSGAAVPTTLAPTLPATGSGGTNLGLVLAALALLVLGGGALTFARRS